jgi:glycosyltransferase involved in cell wall biosynthesis
MSRPRLLFLSHRLPYPPHNGAAIRTYNILSQLARDFEITALCFDRDDPSMRNVLLETRIAGLARFGRFEAFPIPQQRSRARLLWDHARSVLAGRPYTWYLHDSAIYDRRLGELLRTGGFGLAHVDSLDLVHLLPRLDGLPVACTHHNVESALLRRRAAAVPAGLLRWYLGLQADHLEKTERAWLPRVALNIAVSDEDRALLASVAPAARVETIPNGVDTEFFRPARPGEDCGGGLVFVGGTTWFPNRDALEWFAGQVLPELRRQSIGAPVTWVGRVSEEERSRYDGRLGLRLTGYVDDIRPYLTRADVFVAPLRVGGGTRLKLLDAWAMGKAVVSTRVGAEGLGATHGETMLFAETPQEFADAVTRLLRDASLRRRLGEAARRRVEHVFGWGVIGARLRDLYLRLATS